jgi:hypothetical protein
MGPTISFNCLTLCTAEESNAPQFPQGEKWLPPDLLPDECRMAGCSRMCSSTLIVEMFLRFLSRYTLVMFITLCSQILPVFPSIVNLSMDKFQAALSRILQVSFSS